MHRCLFLLLSLFFLVHEISAGSLRGRIRSEDGKALRGVSITILRSGWKQPVILKSGADGSFSSTVAIPDIARVELHLHGYRAAHFTAAALQDGTMNVTLRAVGGWGDETVLNERLHYTQKDASGSGGSMADHEVHSMPKRRERASGAASSPSPMPAATHYEAAPAAAKPVLKRAPRMDASPRIEGEVLSAPPAGTGAGRLTSGEVADFSKWRLWQDMDTTEMKGHRSTWKLFPAHRYTIQLQNADGSALSNAHVRLHHSGRRDTVWVSRTDNTGKAELWDGLITDGNKSGGALSATISYDGNTLTQEGLRPFAEGINMVRTGGRCKPARQLDIAFLVDATGSMGDEISYLKAELTDIIGRCRDSLPGTDLRTGCLFYRDGGDDYLARISDFNADISKTAAFIRDNDAGGGGDTPEGVDAALEEGLNSLSWREGNTVRLAFLVLDAPPHADAATVARIQRLAAAYAAKGIRLVPVVCSGADKSTEYLMRSLALATNGTYLFLTSHSGIGGAHLAPTTDKYEVEYLNGLICRIIQQFSWMPDCKQIAAAGNGSDTASVVHPLPVSDSTVPVKVIQWRYYPNPTSGLLHVSIEGTGGDLYVCDLSGKILSRFRPDATGNATVDMTQYPAGLYFIRYYYGADGMVSGKFTVVH